MRSMMMLDDDLMMLLLLHFPPSHPCASGRKKHTPGISQNLSFMKSSPTRKLGGGFQP